MLTITGNKVHLCDSCGYNYPTCPADTYDVIFGDGVGCDNICACAEYWPNSKLEKLLEEIEATDNAMFTRGDILERIRRFI